MAGRSPPNPFLPTHPISDIGRDAFLSPIEKPCLKIDYTIKMARGGGQGDLEYWLEGSPRREPTPQKNPPLGGNRQDPRSLADTGMASRGRRTKGAFLPGRKGGIWGGGWKFLLQGCESFLGQDSQTAEWHKFFLGHWVWPGIINNNKLPFPLTPQNGDRAPSAFQGPAEK